MSTVYTSMAKGFPNEPIESSPPPPPPPPKRDDRDATPEVGMSSLGLDIPLSPISPSSPSSATEKTKKYSLLADLMESEKAYVELLTGIIRKVAAAWSRSNLPPPELDVMFRSVEGVYKTNRALLAKLKELGENPSSPKALGDLLMRWIDELEQPYATYANKFCIGFDDWAPVKTNPKVLTVLQTFSTSNPPPSTLPQPTRSLDPARWTLDALFLLPKGRLQYYKKLYSKLLKGTTPGRSDHRLLTGALGKLDGLLATLDERASAVIYTPRSHHAQPPRINTEVNPIAAMIPIEPFANIPTESATLLSGHFGTDPASAATSMRGSFSSRDERCSQETALTSDDSRESSQAAILSVLDLEKRLATENTLDLFTMQPKQIRLQIAPPTLPYARELRLSAKVLVRFTPKTTGVEVMHPRGHVYILSDLFLICEEMTRDERVARGEDGKDIHLCYPPLSGKVLNVIEAAGQENAVQVSIMRRESLILEAGSRIERDRIIDEFRECISFAKTISRAAQEPVPPLPPLSSLPQSPTTYTKTADGSSRDRPERAVQPRSHPQSQPSNAQSERTDVTTTINRALATSSPTQNNGPPVASLSQPYPERQDVVSVQPEAIHDSRRDVVGSPQSTSALPQQRAPTSQNPGAIYPSRTSSSGRATNSPPSSFAPGQIVPILRSASIQSQSPPFMMPTSEPPGGQGRLYSPPIVQNHAPQNPTLRHNPSMQSVPILRSASIQSQSPPSMMPTSEPPGGQGRVYSPPIVQNHAPQNPTLRHNPSMQSVPILRSASIQSQPPPSMMPTSEPPGGQGRVYSPPIVQNHGPQNPTLRHNASMHSLRHQPLQHHPSLYKPSHPSMPPTSHPRMGPRTSNEQPFTPYPPNPPVLPHSDGPSSHRLQKSQSSRSLYAQHQHTEAALPPIPSLPDGMPIPQHLYGQRNDSMPSLNSPMLKPLLPSMQMGSRTNSIAEPSILDPSPPSSPVEEPKPLGPVRSVITAETKCKVFQKQHHAQWKSLGSANLTLYSQEPTNVKQLVVEASNKEKSVLISTIVLTSGVERVGKTGVAVELSDTGGARTGIIYMIQLRNEASASKLFRALLAGSDRAA